MYTRIAYFALTIFFVASCVPATKFTELQQEEKKCQEEKKLLQSENEALSVEIKELEDFKKRTSKTLASIGEDTIALRRQLESCKNRYQLLQDNYNEMSETQETLLKGSARETSRLLSQIQTSQEDLQVREDKLAELAANLQEKENRLNAMQQELKQRDIRLTELENLLTRKDSAVKALKDKVQNALLGFQDQGLSVTRKNGKVYVSLEEKLLFPSGSTVVDPNGRAALQRLASVLEQNDNINIMIEGHTDDVPVIPDERMKDNWDLSVLRATSIVRILLNHSDIDPTRLTVSGRSEYLPLKEGKSEEARRANRRTEIILTPNIDELLEIIENTNI